MKQLVVIVVAVAIVAAIGVFGYREALMRAWIPLNEWDIRSEGLLKVGDLAPDFELESVGNSGPHTLSDFYRDKPLVLVFGSYT